MSCRLAVQSEAHQPPALTVERLRLEKLASSSLYTSLEPSPAASAASCSRRQCTRSCMHKLCVRCGVEFAFVPKGALSFGLVQTLLADPVCTHDSQIIA